MTPQLQIDFVSDVACPWCAIGLASLEEALRRTTGTVDARLAFHPFELNPDMPAEGQNLDEHIAGKYNSTPEQAMAGREGVRARAQSVGFAFNSSSRSRVYNTFNAHRLLYWARGTGHQLALKRALFKANFTDDANISDPEVLVAIATAAGLDTAMTRQILESNLFAKEVSAEEQLWISRGIQSVPGIVINEQWLITGGQPPEVFEQALRDIAASLQSSR